MGAEKCDLHSHFAVPRSTEPKFNHFRKTHISFLEVFDKWTYVSGCWNVSSSLFLILKQLMGTR